MLTLDDTAAPNLIRGYGPGEIRLAERTLRTSCLITAQQLVEPWRPQSIAAIAEEDLAPLFALGVSIVLLAGAGAVVFPAPRIRGAFGARRMGLEVMELGAACRTFNVLVQEGRSVAAAFVIAAGQGRPKEDTGQESSSNQPIIRS